MLERARSVGVSKSIITAGNLEDSCKTLELTARWGEQYGMFSTIGVHPTRCDEFQPDPDAHTKALSALLRESSSRSTPGGRVVAVGSRCTRLKAAQGSGCTQSG